MHLLMARLGFETFFFSKLSFSKFAMALKKEIFEDA